MRCAASIRALIPALVIVGLAATLFPANQSFGAQATATDTPNCNPEDGHIKDLAKRAIDGQHEADLMELDYERIEHRITRNIDDKQNSHILDDRTYRVVPTGAGTLKILLNDNGHPVDPGQYHLALQNWERSLEMSLNPDDPRVKASLAKSEKREQERNELVDGVENSFCAEWLGTETHDGRVFDIVQLDPNPAFQAHTMAQEVLTHVRAKVWLDDQSGQLARADADIIRDISFGAFLAKVYRGGHFEVVQEQVAPGLWLPIRYQYDYVGRKFLFSFEDHEVTEISHYHFVGSPNEALETVRAELQNPLAIPDP